MAMNKLKKLIEPFVLRRIKGEVLTELPDKMISVLNSQMVDEQRDIYLSYLAKAKKKCNGRNTRKWNRKEPDKNTCTVNKIKTNMLPPKSIYRQLQGRKR